MRGLMAFRQQLSNKVDRARGERQIASTGSPSNNCIGCGSDQLQRNGPYDAFGGHARGGLQMNRTLTKWAAAGALSLCTAIPALAGSVTQPGETVGLNAGAPLPPGWYAINTVDWGCRNTNPQHTCSGLTIPVVAWSTPWTFWGARFQLLAAWPAVEVGVQRTTLPEGTLSGTYFNG